MTIDTAAKPAFYIFTQQDGRARCIGAAFRHETGNGYSLVIHRQHYLALAPKPDAGKGGKASTFPDLTRWTGQASRLRRDFNRRS